MSRLSIVGTDEAGDTVKVAPEQTNQNTRVCVDTYISYIIYCIDIAGILIGFIRATETLRKN